MNLYGDVLGTLLDTHAVEIDRLTTTIIGAGLVPEDLLEAPASDRVPYGGEYVR